jgi:hypothetical protein
MTRQCVVNLMVTLICVVSNRPILNYQNNGKKKLMYYCYKIILPDNDTENDFIEDIKVRCSG